MGSILVLVNTLSVAALMGVIVYTKVLHKRTPITEATERARLEQEEKQAKLKPTVKGSIAFDPMKVNLSTDRRDAAGDPSLKHMVALTFTLEVSDMGKQGDIEKTKPLFLDEIISLLGKKTFDDLTTVQGRYLLRSEMIDIANRILGEPIVTNLYFSEFLVQ